VPCCNLVVRFDLSATVGSFIQSRGRARMQNSDYVLLVRRHVFYSSGSFAIVAS
jgi:endoribonuclease Dicer